MRQRPGGSVTCPGIDAKRIDIRHSRRMINETAAASSGHAPADRSTTTSAIFITGKGRFKGRF